MGEGPQLRRNLCAVRGEALGLILLLGAACCNLVVEERHLDFEACHERRILRFVFDPPPRFLVGHMPLALS